MTSEYERESTTTPQTPERVRDPREIGEHTVPYEAQMESVPDDIRRLSVARAGRFRMLRDLLQPIRPQFGQIWSTQLAPATHDGESEDVIVPRLVVVLEEQADTLEIGQTSVLALPVSVDLAYQSDRDLLIPESDSPLGYSFMVEVWNEVTMLRTQLVRYLGVLPQPLARALGRLYRQQSSTETRGDEQDDSEIPNDFVEYVGPAITHDDDRRTEFQEDEVEACEYLRRPLLQLLSERVEGRAEDHEVLHRKVIQFPNLPVQRGLLPRFKPAPQRDVALAAASEREDGLPLIRLATSHGESIASLRYDPRSDSLSLVWEHLVPGLEGKTLRVTLRTKSGQTYAAPPVAAQTGQGLPLIQGSRLLPGAVEAVSLEFTE